MSAEDKRELDAWIAEHVMGRSHLDKISKWSGQGARNDLRVPYYTTNDADAMAVLKVCIQKLPLHIEIAHNGTNWFVSRPDEDAESYVMADTLNEAICLFAKKLHGG